MWGGFSWFMKVFSVGLLCTPSWNTGLMQTWNFFVSWPIINSLKGHLYKGGSYLAKCYIKNKNHYRSSSGFTIWYAIWWLLFKLHSMRSYCWHGKSCSLDPGPRHNIEVNGNFYSPSYHQKKTPGSNHIWVCVSECAVLLYIFSRKGKIIISVENRKQWSRPQPGTLLT
jgi:hypothetical protein